MLLTHYFKIILHLEYVQKRFSSVVDNAQNLRSL